MKTPSPASRMSEARLASVKPHGEEGAVGFFMKDLACLARITRSPMLPRSEKILITITRKSVKCTR